MSDESKALINSWFKLATTGEKLHLSEKEDAYFRFMALWVAFNAFLSSKYLDILGDCKKVRAFANDPSNVSLHKEQLMENCYLEAVKVLKERGVKDMRPSGNSDCNINDLDCFLEVMMCVYQVRCNLFHGDKSVDDERDSSLVKAAHTIVTSHMRVQL